MEFKYNKNLNFEDIYDHLSNESKKIPITKWDFGASCSQDISAQVDRGVPKQLKSAQRSSITIRVWNQEGLVGITSTSDLTKFGLEKSLMLAYEASKYGNKKEIPQFSALAKEIIHSSPKPFKKPKGISSILSMIKEAENELLNSHQAIKTVPYNGLSEVLYEKVYINSDGASRKMRVSQSSIYLYARAEEPGRKPRSSGAVRIAYSSEDLDIKSCIREASMKTINHLNYEKVSTGTYLICFTPEAFLELMNAFSSMFNARSILDGISLSSEDSIGKRIAIPNLSLNDNSLDPNNIGGCDFDGEGTPTRNICIINQGILENLIHSEATARHFKTLPSGHAGIGAKASVSTDWMVVSNAMKQDMETFTVENNLLNKEYILIESLSALHAGVKPSQGSFSLPFDGWLVRNGERVSIEAATVAGDIRDVLNQIINIETKQIVTHMGISPHVWVDGLSITGE